MTLLDRIAKRFGYSRTTKKSRRSYHGAKLGRLTDDWILSALSPGEEVRGGLRTIRNRARDLERNNDYVKKFLSMVVTNVVGCGMQLQARAKRENGELDRMDNDTIETGFRDWAKKGIATVDGQKSWLDCQRLFIRSVARDGEVLVRKVRGFDNGFGFALQFLESDFLDEEDSRDLANGNQVRMGVEFDVWDRPVAYHLYTRHPGEFGRAGLRKERVAATDIIHGFLEERTGGTRGISWLHTPMMRLRHLGGYEEAELIAARTASCKMGFYTNPDGDQEIGDTADEDEGDFQEEAEPGLFGQLPVGWDFKAFDPTHPSGNFQPFIKATLRGIASGLNVSYNTLASDLEGVNFSSMRSGVIEERDHWKVLQKWMIEHFCEPVFLSWLEMAIVSGALRLPLSRFEKFKVHEWKPRRWEWVDPLKDAKANEIARDNLWTTDAEIIADRGGELEDTYRQRRDELDLQAQLKLKSKSSEANTTGGETDDDSDEEDDGEEAGKND